MTQPRKSDVSLQSVANSIASKKQRSLGEPTEEELMETSLTEEKKEIQQPSKTCDEMKTSEPEPFEGERERGREGGNLEERVYACICYRPSA